MCNILIFLNIEFKNFYFQHISDPIMLDQILLTNHFCSFSCSKNFILRKIFNRKRGKYDFFKKQRVKKSKRPEIVQNAQDWEIACLQKRKGKIEHDQGR